MFQEKKFCLVVVFHNELINGYHARLPFRWSWKEGWEISIFLMPFCQPGKPV
jgi:hypothetical protein